MVTELREERAVKLRVWIKKRILSCVEMTLEGSFSVIQANKKVYMVFYLNSDSIEVQNER